MIKAEPMVGHNSIDDAQACSFITRAEAIQDRIDAENSDKSELFKEMRAKGYDTDAFRLVLKERANQRKGKADKIAVVNAVADLIRAALARKGV